MANNCECLLEYYGTEEECNDFVKSLYNPGAENSGGPYFDFSSHQSRHPVGFDLHYMIANHYKDTFKVIARFWTKWSPPSDYMEWLLTNPEDPRRYAKLFYWESGAGVCGEISVNEDTRELQEWYTDQYKGFTGG